MSHRIERVDRARGDVETPIGGLQSHPASSNAFVIEDGYDTVTPLGYMFAVIKYKLVYDGLG